MSESANTNRTVTNAPSVGSDVDETAAAAADDTPVPPAFGPPAEPGEVGTLGPYRVVRQLGHGGMGAVYLGIDTRLGRKLALKVMLPKFAANPAAKERFLREARAAAQISHDNVVTVYEADERDGVPYIAMQFLQGYPLDDYLRKKGSPNVPRILRIARETAAGLAAAHAIGLVHRDIKPGNLWLEAPKGRVKVLDFGLAKPVDAEVELTRSGAVVGTPAYMSPEQARGRKVDHRTDLFSLGAVLYRLCTGKLPFEGPNTMAVLMALGTEEPTPVREVNPDVPEPVAELVHRLLAKNPDHRVPTADDVVRRLDEIEDGLSAPLAQAVDMPSVSLPQVVYVPIPVTGEHANNVFADLTESGSLPPEELPEGQVKPTQKPKPSRKKPGGKGTWVAAGLAVLFAGIVVGGVIIIIKNKDGTETKIEVPDGATVTVKGNDGKTIAEVPGKKQPVADDTPDRKAAEWVLSVGGKVGSEDRWVNRAPNLPEGPFVLVKADLRKCGDRVTADGLALLAACPGLRLLLLQDIAVDDAALAPFAGRTDITHLGLDNTQVTEAGVALFKGCTGLQELHLANLPVSDTGLAPFAGCRHLTTITFPGTGITDAGLGRFKGCTRVQTAYLSDTALGDAALAHLVGWSQLATLDIRNTRVTDDGLAHLAGLKQLASLNLRGTKVTAAGVAKLAKAGPGCRIEWDDGVIEATDVDRRAAEYVLSLGGVVKVNGDRREIRAATELPKEPFTLTWASNEWQPGVTDDGLANFKGCVGLTTLHLLRAEVTEAGLANFKGCTGLVSLDLNQTTATDAGLARLRGCENLEILGLSNTKVTDAGLAHFKDCTKLTHLLLSNTGVTDAGLAHFKDCELLTHLELDKTGVTDAGLAHFKDCTKLWEVNLFDSAVTDAGLEHLKDRKELAILGLSDTTVTDAGLEHLKGCKTLKTLRLHRTKTTAEGREAFHAAVPGCKIEWDGGVIEPAK